MRNVSIIGTGQTPVAEHFDADLRQLAARAIRAAMAEAGITRAGGVFVGNMLAGELAGQEHTGALMADAAGLRGVEAVRFEAAGASGGAAVRAAFLAVASGMLDVAVVLGVEKLTDQHNADALSALTNTLDSDYEASEGATPASQAALLMRRYMHEYGASLSDFAGFSVNAHANGATNPNALYRNRISAEQYLNAPPVCDPVRLFDQAPLGDGAAALVLVPEEATPRAPVPAVRLVASAAASDSVALHDRHDLLSLESVYEAAVKAYEMAGVGPGDIDVLELHDSYSVLAAMSLEAAGFTRRGQGYLPARDGTIGLMGHTPTSTFGGLKARGDVGGATGVYQIVEIVQQLRGTAGDNQVPNARWGMSLSMGGIGANAVIHILRAPDT